MEYDAENRLTKITTPQDTLEYKYDAEGRRIKKISSNETVVYVSASYEIRNTHDAIRTTKHILTNSGHSVTVEKINGKTHTYYYHQDHLGSTLISIDITSNSKSTHSIQIALL